MSQRHSQQRTTRRNGQNQAEGGAAEAASPMRTQGSWNRGRRFLAGDDARRGRGENHGWAKHGQLCGQWCKPIRPAFGPARLDQQVAPLDVAEVRQAGAESVEARSKSRWCSREQDRDALRRFWRLRQRVHSGERQPRTARSQHCAPFFSLRRFRRASSAQTPGARAPRRR